MRGTSVLKAFIRNQASAPLSKCFLSKRSKSQRGPDGSTTPPRPGVGLSVSQGWGPACTLAPFWLELESGCASSHGTRATLGLAGYTTLTVNTEDLGTMKHKAD